MTTEKQAFEALKTLAEGKAGIRDLAVDVLQKDDADGFALVKKLENLSTAYRELGDELLEQGLVTETKKRQCDRIAGQSE